MNTRHLHDDLETWQFLVERGLVLTCLLPDKTRNADDMITTTVFRLSGIYYTLPTTAIYTIQPLGAYKPIPFAQPCIVGVVNVDGQAIGVFDIRSLVTCIRTAPRPEAPLLILRLQEVDIAILADSLVFTPPASASDDKASDTPTVHQPRRAEVTLSKEAHG